MTPKEKAQRLTDNMGNIPDGGFGSIGLYEAKQCALVAVNEIINVLNPEHWGLEMNIAIDELIYWRAVKQEIESL
ncbi:MAG: hypothetical protein EB127_01645 [Alphaproteobacteria bacterium]|nr:hypothetical protein [Alphaproteobacteria bacterium]